MGCGCGKKKTVVSAPLSSGAPVSAEPRTYDVIGADGAVVASSTNPVLARVEARRTGGTVVLRSTASVPQA